MSFYESLDIFVGAGLMSAAPAIGANVAPGGVAAGAGLSAFLRERGETGRFGEVLDWLAREVWLSKDTRGIQVEAAQKHARALAGILEQVRPKPEQVTAALAAQPEDRAADATAIAVDVIARAHEQDLFKAQDLTDHVALFLIERLFVQLTADASILSSLGPHLVAFAQSTPSEAAPSPAAETSATMPDTVPAPSAPEPAPSPVERTPSAASVPAPTVPTSPAAAPTTSLTDSVRQRYNIGDAAMSRFEAILEAQQLKPEERATRLEELAVWLQVTTAQLVKPSNDDPEIRRLKTCAADALTNGDFESAMDFLNEVRRALRAMRRRTEQRLEDEMHQLKLQAIDEAAACARLGELAFAGGKYDNASELFAEAADSVPTSELAIRLNYSLRQADALYRKGDMADDELILSAAAEHYRRALQAAENHDNESLLVEARCALGSTLSRVSRFADNTTHLREAVDVWQGALRLMDRTVESRRVANVFANLGDALYRIGNIDTETQSIRQAADAYTEAVSLLNSNELPLDWALAQLGRGTCLLRLAEQEGQDRLWLDAAAALVPALELLEAGGLGEVGEQARASLRTFHANFARLLGSETNGDGTTVH